MSSPLTNEGLVVVTDKKTLRKHFYFNGVELNAERLRSFGREGLQKALMALDPLIRNVVAQELASSWPIWARANQLVPEGEWSTCLVLAGRGFGKSRMGAQAVCEWHRQGFQFINLIGATSDDAWDIMVEGESGIMNYAPKDIRPTIQRHKGRLQWPNGAISLVFTADKPERLRGKQHQKIWGDELAAWRYEEAYDQILMGLRLPSPSKAFVKTPQALFTTTPKPTKLIRTLASEAKNPKSGVIIVRGKTSDNKENLAPSFYNTLLKKYEGTRLGRQELDAEILDDNAGALWNRKLIEDCRYLNFDKDEEGIKQIIYPSFKRIVVAIDPAVTANATSDETGIIVCGLGENDHGFILEDCTPKERVSPDAWAKIAIDAYNRWGADRIVAETNQGGDMVESVIRASSNGNIPFKGVRATKGKYTRAEPVAALYEQQRIHHFGVFGALEDQMCDWNPTTDKKSPDRMDALVWGITELMLGDTDFGFLNFVKDKSKAQEEKKFNHNPTLKSDIQPMKPVEEVKLYSQEELDAMPIKERLAAKAKMNALKVKKDDVSPVQTSRQTPQNKLNLENKFYDLFGKNTDG